MKTLEQRQEDWVKKIIQPQELNQARLYAIETRIKEGENLRQGDLQFMRDTTKKLIYAIEQQQITTTEKSFA